jgi:hypothetical protein
MLFVVIHSKFTYFQIIQAFVMNFWHVMSVFLCSLQKYRGGCVSPYVLFINLHTFTWFMSFFLCHYQRFWLHDISVLYSLQKHVEEVVSAYVFCSCSWNSKELYVSFTLKNTVEFSYTNKLSVKFKCGLYQFSITLTLHEAQIELYMKFLWNNLSCHTKLGAT